MASVGTLTVDVTANLANLNRGFDRLDRRLRSFQGTMGRTQGSVSTSTIAIGNAYAMMGQMAVKGIKLVIDAIATLIKKTIELSTESVKMAIQYESSMVSLNKIFGTAGDVITEFARTQSRALNLSKKSVIEYGNTFGGLLMNIGMAKDETALYSTQLLKTAAVIQSNKPKFTMETVLDKMRSGILGNVQAIDDLGIEVKIGMLQATDAFKKFANGRTWSQIPFQTQQIIRMLGIMEQSAKLNGETLANTTNTALSQFNAILKDAQLALGQALLPLLQMAIPLMLKFAEVIEFATIKIKQFSDVLFGNNEVLEKSTEDVTDGQNKFAKSITDTAKAAAKSLAPFDKLNNLQEKMAEGTTPQLSAGGTAKKDSGLGGIADIGLGKTMTIMIEGLSQAFKDFGVELKILTELAKPILKPLAKSFELFAIGAIANGTLLLTGFTTALKGVNGIIKLNKGIMKVALKSLLTFSFDPITQKIKLAFMVLRTALDAIWTSIKERMKLKIEEITGLPWDVIRQAIILKFLTIRTKIKQIWESIKAYLKTKITEITGLSWDTITKKMEDVWKGIKNTAFNIWEGIKTVVKNATRGIIDIVNGMINVINSVKISSPEIRNPFTGDVLVPARTFGFDISNIDTGFLDNASTKHIPTNKLTDDEGEDIPRGVKGGGGGSFANSQPIDVTLMIDNDVLAKVQVPAHEKEKQRVGNSLTKGGGGGSF